MSGRPCNRGLRGDYPTSGMNGPPVRDDRLVARTSARLTRRIRSDFPPDVADAIVEHLADVPETLPVCSQEAERVQASIVFTARGDYKRFLAALEQARSDWRDTLVGSGGEEDWRRRLHDVLGQPDTTSHTHLARRRTPNGMSVHLRGRWRRRHSEAHDLSVSTTGRRRWPRGVRA